MKARITQLNAPWPSGAAVGDVIELPAVPAWAVGKCEPVPDDVEATVELGAPADGDPLAALRAEASAFIDRLRDEHRQQVAELTAKAGELQAALSSAAEAKAAAEAQAAELQAKVAELTAKLEAKPEPTPTKRKG